MKRLFFLSPMAAALLLSFSLLSTGLRAETPAYNYIDVSHVWENLDGLDDSDGYEVDIAFSFADQWFAKFFFGDFDARGDVEFSAGAERERAEIDGDGYSVGLGYFRDIDDDSNFFVSLSYINVDADVRSLSSAEKRSESDSGYGLALGVRSYFAEDTELSAGLEFDDLSDALLLDLNALYYFSSRLGARLGFSLDDEGDHAVALGARLRF